VIALLLGAGVAQAQVVSPLGGSTNNPQGPQPAAPATTPTRPIVPRPSVTAPVAPAPTAPTTAAPSSNAPAAATTTPSRTRRTLAERFDAANTTHDGKLTLEQARAGRLRAVARDFDKIDKDKRGYVSLDQIKSFQTEQRAARRTARAQKPAQTR